MSLPRSNIFLHSVLAAATSLVAPSSFAQTNVTLYGIIDGGTSYVTNSAHSNGRNHSTVQMLSGGEAADRFGFKGTEDLGGGIKAIFTLENGFSVANGTLQQGGRLFGRQAFVGLQTPYGTLTFGRQKTILYDYFFALDPLSYYSWSLATQDVQFANRVDNSIKYFANIGLFTVDALFSTGYDATITNGGQVPGEFRVGQEASLGTSFTTGPVLLAVAYDLRRGTSIATQGDKEQRLAVGANYEVFSGFKLFAGYKWLNSSVPATAARSDMYYGGLQYRFTPAFSVAAATYYTDIKTAGQHPIDFGLNAAYSLSKVTSIYAEVNYVKNSNGSNLGVAGFGTGVVAGANQTGVAIGINHLF